MIKADLVPDLDHWFEEEVEAAELADRVLGAMRRTDPVAFSIYDAGASSLSFTAPDFAEGHFIEVQFNDKGCLGCVGLAG